MAKLIRTWNKKYKTRECDFDRGGNGIVSKVTDIETESKKLVIKELSKDSFSEEKKARFIEEIKIMSKNYNRINGIMPVYDYSEKEYWYVMPEAELLINYIKRLEIDFDGRIELIIKFAEILKKLHDNKIYHRDIKPLNLYILNDKPYFGDFGLVDFPEKASDFTKSDKGLGAIFTIAPEMKRDPKHADGKKADVYSFAKTAWMIITLDEKGFDGQYNRNDPLMSISLSKKFNQIHLKEFEDLISDATNNNPDERPTIEEFFKELINYRIIKADHYRSQLSDWKYISNQIFGKIEPTSCCWEDIDGVINILNIIGRNPAYNHMFYRDGGLDFEYAKKAAEEGCIEIYTGGNDPDIVKLKRLLYQGFGEDFSWNYFLLELDELSPIEPFNWNEDYEELVEDTPGHYVSSEYARYGVYDYDTEEKFPKGWKLVRRYKTGKMLIMLKEGGYNSISNVYDGRHVDCSADDFRKYIQEMINVEKWAIDNSYNKRSVLNHYFNKNPFVRKKALNFEISFDETDELRCVDYLKKNYASWKFIDYHNNQKDSNIRYRFVFDYEGGIHGLTYFMQDREEYVLSIDGTFKTGLKDEEILWIYDRNEVKRVKKVLNSFMQEQCNNNGYIFPEHRIFILTEIDKCGQPTHLFTYGELVEKLTEADDRRSNTVVINEDGYIDIVSDYGKELYPVRNETFPAGGLYVGKYANVTDVADDLYPDLLGCWLDYLKNGESHYIDISKYSSEDIGVLEKEILELMKV